MSRHNVFLGLLVSITCSILGCLLLTPTLDSNLPKAGVNYVEQMRKSVETSKISTGGNERITEEAFSKQSRNDSGTIQHGDVFDDPGISPEWRPPKGGYCYKHGGDWSACAGSHLLYPPASPAEILSRETICLHEPLCWKQLDWLNSDPPEMSCPKFKKSLRFYDWSYHDGTMASMSSFLETTMTNASQSQQEVFLCNHKKAKNSIRNYHHDFRLCPSWEDFEKHRSYQNNDRSRRNFQNLQVDEHAREANVHIFGFGPHIWEHYMTWNRTLLLNFCHRMNMFRCSREESALSFENLRLLASSGPRGAHQQAPFNIIGPGYVHDVEYVRHYTGLNPVYLAFSVLDLLTNLSYSGSNPEILINWKDKIPPELSNSEFTFVNQNAKPYELEDLTKYKAVVVVPYSITNAKSLEQYEMNLPLFVPTPDFAIELGRFFDRTATYGPYCNERFTDKDHPGAHPNAPFEYSPNARAVYGDSKEAETFWIGFSEVYVWPCVTYFSSWQDLLSQLRETSDSDLKNTSHCMKQANKWRRHELKSNLCWALERVDPGPRKSPSSHEDALLSLYGKDTSLFPS